MTPLTSKPRAPCGESTPTVTPSPIPFDRLAFTTAGAPSVPHAAVVQHVVAGQDPQLAMLLAVHLAAAHGVDDRFTLTRGHVAVHDGEIRTQEGHGKFVAREANATVNNALSQWKELTSPQPVVRAGIPATGV